MITRGTPISGNLQIDVSEDQLDLDGSTQQVGSLTLVVAELNLLIHTYPIFHDFNAVFFTPSVVSLCWLASKDSPNSYQLMIPSILVRIIPYKDQPTRILNAAKRCAIGNI